MDRVVGPPDRLSGEFDAADLVGYGGQHRVNLGPRHVLADTAVDADTQGQVVRGPPFDVESICSRPMTLVQIGGA